MAICKKCLAEKPVTDFYKSAGYKTGYDLVCKKCRIAAVDPVKNRVNARRFYYELGGKEKKSVYNSHPDRMEKRRVARKTAKGRARHKLTEAVRRGFITKPNKCQECGIKTVLHGHHTDYSKPLFVDWLCSGCHGTKHRAL